MRPRVWSSDTGGSRSFAPFQSRARKAFNGLCLALVRGKPGPPGQIKLTAQAEGVKPGTVAIQTPLKAD
jgi:beta-galactosidase